MPIEIKTEPTQDLTVFTLAGTVRLAELTSVLNTYGDDGPTQNEIYDIRALCGERLSADEINLLADYFKHFVPARRPAGSRTAIVVANDVDYGIARMIALMTEDQVPFKVEIFRAIEAARDWIEGV